MSNLVIAVGGTGKSVALVYLKLAKFFGKPFDLLILDVPFGREKEIDDQLNVEGIQPADFMTAWRHGTQAQGSNTFLQVIGLPPGHAGQPVAKALFSQAELDTLVEDGMNCKPIVGATIAMRKFWSPDEDDGVKELRQKVAQYRNVFLVCSITGGTGSGVAPTLAKWLTDECNVGVHGLLFLPYIDIGPGSGGGPSNAAMRANTYATLSYLSKPPGSTAFQDFVVLGLPEGLQPDSTTISGSHPLHLVAATYILYFDQFQGKNPELRRGSFYLEIAAGGLRESEVQPTDGLTFANAVYRQVWYREVLNYLGAQKPDQAWDMLTPPIASQYLAWGSLRDCVRELSISSTGYGARKDIWAAMQKRFIEGARGAQRRLERFEAITARDAQHLVYNVDWDWMKRQAEASLRRARAAVRGVGTPDINREVTTSDAAVGAAEALSNDVFGRLGQQASAIAKGGARDVQRVGNSTVFLPPGVMLTTGPKNIVCLKLDNLNALIEQFKGARDAVNMPDPQARRFQFAINLEQALGEYRQNPNLANWEGFETLAQFTALLEGVIFGQLEIRLFDLSVFGFQSEAERRVLGVLMDSSGNVYGGTDPETLFFPAPDAWRRADAPLRLLADTNAGIRDRIEGQSARALIRSFYETFSTQSRPLWLTALDEYLQLYQSQGTVDDRQLRQGWKQIGPVVLRLPDGAQAARYIPVYAEDFVKKATYCLCGRFVPRDQNIDLETQANLKVGQVSNPSAVQGLTSAALGAGMVTVVSANPPGQMGYAINYDQLADHYQALVGALSPSAVKVAGDPFLYPDVIRLPFAYDGFLADYFLKGSKADQELGKRFIDVVRGQGTNNSPLGTQSLTGGDLVTDGDVVYVETYEQKPVRELSALGQALWMIFAGEATEVIGRDIFNDKLGNVVLEFNGRRFITSVDPQSVDEAAYAADLRGLVRYINLPDADILFRAAVHSWLKFVHLQPKEGDYKRHVQLIGGRTWWKPRP